MIKICISRSQAGPGSIKNSLTIKLALFCNCIGRYINFDEDCDKKSSEMSDQKAALNDSYSVLIGIEFLTAKSWRQ